MIHFAWKRFKRDIIWSLAIGLALSVIWHAAAGLPLWEFPYRLAFVWLGSTLGTALICMFRGRRDSKAASPDPQSEMYAAFQRYCDALDEAALDGDTKEYDRIRAMGWRRFGVDAA